MLNNRLLVFFLTCWCRTSPFVLILGIRSKHSLKLGEMPPSLLFISLCPLSVPRFTCNKLFLFVILTRAITFTTNYTRNVRLKECPRLIKKWKTVLEISAVGWYLSKGFLELNYWVCSNVKRVFTWDSPLRHTSNNGEIRLLPNSFI